MTALGRAQVTEKYVQSEREIFREMRTGKFNRTVAQTSMNEHSSRSARSALPWSPSELHTLCCHGKIMKNRWFSSKNK